MNYYIAYKDNKGKDFDGLPWIIPEGGFTDIKIAKNVKNDFIKRGFKDVKLFSTQITDMFEQFDWEFVINHSI